MSSKQARIIAVANEKGGVGKTATVVNLGAALSLKGEKVLIVDMDPQHNATIGLGVDVSGEMKTVYDLVSTGNNVSVRETIVGTEWKGLELIPSHVDLAGAEIELIDVEGRENRLKDALGCIVEEYDFILMDTPPSLSLLTVNVFAFASEVLIPCQTQPYAFAALEGLFDTIKLIKEEINPVLDISGIVATFFDSRTGVSHRILDKLSDDKRYKSLLYNAVIRVNTTISTSVDAGKPVVFYRRSSYGAIDYIELAKEIIKG